MCGHSEIQMTLADMNGLLVGPECTWLNTESALLSVAVALGADTVPGWSRAEAKLAKTASPVPKTFLADLRQRIRAGEDPLGEAFCRIRQPSERRQQGATYTPQTIVDAMVDWSADFDDASRVVDPGVGSGRYLVSAARRFPRAELIGVEIDPLPAILARANLAVAGLASRSQVILGDYRSVVLPRSDKTLFLGNPPYVRHHLLGTVWKKWLIDEAAKRGHPASQLAGLHVHFFMATVARAQKGDFGAFITAAEWLDVNYGSLVRDLFLAELGGRRIVVIEPSALPFPDAATTAAITYFQVGAKPKSIKLKRVESLEELENPKGNRSVRRERLAAERRWSHLTRIGRKEPEGLVELGELCRVHRGQVTGLNKVWIAGSHSAGLPESVLFPSVTKARELIRVGPVLSDASVLRRVIDLPIDLDELDASERKIVDRFLAVAKSLGAHSGYVAANRKAWWSVGLRRPAPILATYMARRPPAFVRNQAQARHINIAHGIYPREPMSAAALTNLVEYLSRSVCVTDGRTYAGGLTKFEPREMERLLVPNPKVLAKG
jgi:adenine-specific DNA-methyltransferase